MPLSQVCRAYSDRADDYVGLFGSIDDTAEADRRHVLQWATGRDGLIIDVGCGPGQWTDYLRSHGLRVVGIDPVEEFVSSARRRFPESSFRIGSATHLGVEPATLGGVLAWYSLIHSPPEHLDEILAEFARSVRPGQGLLIGFFEGPELAAFDHAVTTAYLWPIDLLAQRVEGCGFDVVDRHARTEPGVRRHGAITARRR